MDEFRVAGTIIAFIASSFGLFLSVKKGRYLHGLYHIIKAEPRSDIYMLLFRSKVMAWLLRILLQVIFLYLVLAFALRWFFDYMPALISLVTLVLTILLAVLTLLASLVENWDDEKLEKLSG